MRISSALAMAAREIAKGDVSYPNRLNSLLDPPDRLYVAGKIPDRPMVAVVGSRDVDSTMIRFTSELVRDLSKKGIVIISGGARGIDTAAHKSALEISGITVAVLGSGFERPYPAENETLFERIARSGALLTEFEPSTHPSKWTFPKRNRIIAAMARAVVVVRASSRSGALITAGHARRLGIPVGAVPGAPSDPMSRGCNQLIRNGAKLVETAEDVVQMLNIEDFGTQLGLPEPETRGNETPSKVPASMSLGEREAMVYDVLSCTTPMHIDDIVSQLGLAPSEAAALLVGLELSGFAEDRGGKYYVKC